MKESFSHRFYWYSTLATSFWSAGNVYMLFLVFFHMEMGLGLEKIGQLGGISGVVGLGVAMGMATGGAYLIDRWHPVRMYFYSMVLQIVIMSIWCKWLFFSPGENVYFLIYLAVSIIGLLSVNVGGISSMPNLIRTLPQSRFGQFCSANAMVRSLTVLVGGLLLGAVIDFGRDLMGGSDFVYRLIWVWRLLFCGIGLLFQILTYREYLKLGGESAFKAPAPWSESKFEELPTASPCVISCKMMQLGQFSWDGIVLIYLLFTAGIVIYSKNMSFLYYGAGPLAISILLWLAIRLFNRRQMPSDRSDFIGGVIHPGVLFIGALQQLLLAATGIWQTFMLMETSVHTAALMWGIESVTLSIVLGLLFICSLVEKKSAVKKVVSEG